MRSTMKRSALTLSVVSVALLLLSTLAPTGAGAAESLDKTAPLCPEGPEYHYVTRDPQLCLIILYFCDPGQEPFFHPQCGCGCKDITVKTADVSTTLARDGLRMSLEEPALGACEPALGASHAPV